MYHRDKLKWRQCKRNKDKYNLFNRVSRILVIVLTIAFQDVPPVVDLRISDNLADSIPTATIIEFEEELAHTADFIT